MVAHRIVKVIGEGILTPCAQLLADRSNLWVEFACISLLHHKLVGALVPDVIAPCTLTRFLECRTIAAERHSVVLPCDVVHTLWELTSKDFLLVSRRSACLHIIYRLSLGWHTNLENKLSIVCQLGSHFAAISIGHHQAPIGAQLGFQRIHVKLHIFVATGKRKGVRHRHLYFVGCQCGHAQA